MPKKTIEDTYKKLTQLEHILVRPDTYVGSIERITTKIWIFDETEQKMKLKDVSYVPGLYKIFDEILVNAADNKQRDNTMKSIEVIISSRDGFVSVKNDGKGIPIEIHKDHNMYVPELIFGNLLTSSNYNDKEQKTTGGRNGYGAKLANIFSTKFIVETYDKERKMKYTQEWTKNMSKKSPPKILENCEEKADYTHVTFYPDFKKFKMEKFDKDIVQLFKKRVYDVAGTSPADMKVKLNKKLIKIKNFREYVDLYLAPGAKKSYERVNDRWEVCIASQDSGHFMQVSHVNSIWTMKGGQHCNYVADQLSAKVVAAVKRKNKGVPIKTAHVKNYLFLFVNALITNPAFTSQTKEFLSSKPATFGSTCDLSEKFLKDAMKTGICENVLAWAKFRQSRDLKKTDGKKTVKLSGIPKLDDANHAGGKQSKHCTLILTEGDSAKALAVSGLSIVGRDKYGVFPLKGKLLNVRDASHKQIMNNAEICNIRKIMGFKANVDYTDQKKYESLRYGHLMIMTDQDHDGSHIKGLVINFIEHFWPSLLKRKGFLNEFITPIVVCKKGKDKKSFFTIPQYEGWKKRNNNGKGWKTKYYKGLGTSTSAEAKQYFSNMKVHKKDFKYIGAADEDNLSLAFSKKRAEDRKNWLAAHKYGTYLDHSKGDVSYTDFVNKELVLFSIADCARSIPSLVDGFKPGQRKILFSCFKRKLKNEVKVAQLAGYVGEHSAYHHGEMSLVGTIVGMAQNFVGSNNINLLVPQGQFGTRHQGGKDSASARYICTYLCKITRTIFHEDDDLVLNFLDDDGLSVEPQYYMPVIPMVLVNGADGIGTGWSTSIPNYNPTELIENMKRMIRGEKPLTMDPWYKGWKGRMYSEEATKYSVWANVAKIGPRKIQIDELPVRMWTDNYKEFLEKMIVEEKVEEISAQHTDTSVSFTVEFKETFPFENVDVPFLKSMNLIKSINTSNMVLFNQKGKIKRYGNVIAIMKEFYTIRLSFYEKRKKALLDKIEEELLKLSNKERFILLVVNGELEIRRKKKKVLCQELHDKGFAIIITDKKKKKTDDDDEDDDDEVDADGDVQMGEPNVNINKGYEYLLRMPIHSLTAEKVQKIMDEKESKQNELDELKRTPVKTIWLRDLNTFEEALADHDLEQDKLREKELALLAKKKTKGQKTLIPIVEKKVDLEYKWKTADDGPIFVKKDNKKKKKKNAKGIKDKKSKVEIKQDEVMTAATKVAPKNEMDDNMRKLVGGFGFMDSSSDEDGPVKSLKSKQIPKTQKSVSHKRTVSGKGELITNYFLKSPPLNKRDIDESSTGSSSISSLYPANKRRKVDDESSNMSVGKASDSCKEGESNSSNFW